MIGLLILSVGACATFLLFVRFFLEWLTQRNQERFSWVVVSLGCSVGLIREVTHFKVLWVGWIQVGVAVLSVYLALAMLLALANSPRPPRRAR